MYDAVSDSYCYPGTTVLKNRANLRTQVDLDLFEEEATAQRFTEPLPSGQLDVRHYCGIQRHLFQDVYTWAGTFRTVRISKGRKRLLLSREHRPRSARSRRSSAPSRSTACRRRARAESCAAP